jgi:antigen flippase
LFVLVEGITSAFHLLMIWVGLESFGVEGVAIAYLVLYVTYPISMLWISRRLIGFSWSDAVRTLVAIMIPFAGALFLLCRFLTVNQSTVIGFVATTGAGIFCLRGLVKRLGPDHRLTQLVRKVPLSRNLLPKNWS